MVTRHAAHRRITFGIISSVTSSLRTNDMQHVHANARADTTSTISIRSEVRLRWFPRVTLPLLCHGRTQAAVAFAEKNASFLDIDALAGPAAGSHASMCAAASAAAAHANGHEQDARPAADRRQAQARPVGWVVCKAHALRMDPQCRSVAHATAPTARRGRSR